ncbi:nuclear transport factor 2 family protein [Streptomyces sp. NPDC002499]
MGDGARQKLERGSLAGVSPAVLEAVARALRLDDAVRAHLLNPAQTADGSEVLMQAAKDGIAGMFGAFPEFHSNIFRVIAEGDLVVIQSRGTFTPDMASGVFDIYRVQHGKVVEHWDIVQNVPSSSANDNSMFGRDEREPGHCLTAVPRLPPIRDRARIPERTPRDLTGLPRT